MHTEFLRASDDDALITITGAHVAMDNDIRRKIRRVLLNDGAHLTLMNQEFYKILDKCFDMSIVSNLHPELHSTHAFHLILDHFLACITNWIFFDRSRILRSVLSQSIIPLAGFLNVRAALHSFSIIVNVLACKPISRIFDDNVIMRVVEALQVSTGALSITIQ